MQNLRTHVYIRIDPARVNRVYALEPNQGMLRRADVQRSKTRIRIEFLDLPGERIPLQEKSVNTVVSTFTLCTIPGVEDAIQGLARVLKPGGKFIFFEHGLSPDAAVRLWQKLTEPLFRWAFEGCHITRNIPALITQAGFTIKQIDTGYLAPFPKCGSYCFWGVAGHDGQRRPTTADRHRTLAADKSPFDSLTLAQWRTDGASL